MEPNCSLAKDGMAFREITFYKRSPRFAGLLVEGRRLVGLEDVAGSDGHKNNDDNQQNGLHFENWKR